MILDLNRDDLISLAKGATPNYKAMDHHMVKDNGKYEASYGRWSWNYNAFSDYTEEEIVITYNICKNSWRP